MLQNITFAQVQTKVVKPAIQKAQQKKQTTKHLVEPVPEGYKPQMSLETFVLKEQRKAYAKNRKHY